MQIRTIDELRNIKGKFVLLRDDFNVQIMAGKIMDAFRIEQSMPTIRRLQSAGARVAICAHLGRPEGQRDMKYTLAPVAEYMKVPLVSDCLNKDFMAGMKDGDVVLLENVRFYAGEESNDSEFAQKLADGFDIYINDAFAVSHRAHASTVGVTKFLPSYAGELLASEIAGLTKVMENPKRPLVGIVSGAKLDTKIKVLKSLAELCDTLVVGGGLGTAFIIANGAVNIKESLYKPEYKAAILEIKQIADAHGCKILTSVDKGVAKEFAPNSIRTNKTVTEIIDSDIIMDEGPASIAEYEREIANAKTIVWNGTLGMAEWQPIWSVGTFDLAHYIANRTKDGELESIIGGGDTVTALEETGTKDAMTYVSTGGGAFLEFIEGQNLPGIDVLKVN